MGYLGLLTIILSLVSVWDKPASIKTLRQFPAPTYYLAARVRDCYAGEIEVDGASNLPSGSVLGVKITEFDQDGWNDFSDYTYTALDEDGFFNAKVHPKKNVRFHRNLVAKVFFGPVYHRQPANVLDAVGRKGEKLRTIGKDGNPWKNPQLGQVSGENFLLESIARVGPCYLGD